MPHATSLILILTAGFVLAFLLGAAASRLKLSPLVGYVLAGVVAGPFTPGFVADPELAPQLAEIGVILLMFGVGLHFSIDDLISVRKTALPAAIIHVNLFTFFGFLVSVFWFGWGPGAGIVFGLSLAVASTVVLLRALEVRGQIETTKGRTTIGLLVVEDLIMVVTLVMLPAIAPYFVGGDLSGMELAKALGMTLLKVGAFIAVMMIVGQRLIPKILERTAALQSRELFTLCVLAIALGIAFGSSELFGVSFALGAFFAGTLLNGSEFSKQAADETLPLRDAFAVLFFVSVGMLFDPQIVLEQPVKLLVTVLLVTVVKAFFGYLIVRFVTGSKGTGILAGVSLAQIGEFSFILASLGLSLKLLPKEGSDLILAASLISIIVNPFMMKVFDRWQARQDRTDENDEPFRLQPEPEPRLDHHVIIVGFGRVGQEIANVLKPRGVALAVVDTEQSWITKAREQGIPSLLGNANSEEVLKALVPERATAAIVAIPNLMEATEIIMQLRRMNLQLSIVARAHSQTAMQHYLERGADAAVLSERELAHSLSEMVMALPHYRGSAHLPQTVR